MNNPPINPFLAAKRQSGIHVILEVRDVLHLRPGWNEEQAKVFLERNAAVIGHTMLIAGAQAVRELLETYRHDC